MSNATRQSNKRTRSNPRKSSPEQVGTAGVVLSEGVVTDRRRLPASYSDAELAGIGRRVVDAYAMELGKASQQAEAEHERRRRDGVTLQGPRLKLAVNTLYSVTMAAASIHQLAQDAGHHDRHDAGWYAEAMANSAMLIARRVDVVLRLLGDPGAGNFEQVTDPEKAIAYAEAAEARDND